MLRKETEKNVSFGWENRTRQLLNTKAARNDVRTRRERRFRRERDEISRAPPTLLALRWIMTYLRAPIDSKCPVEARRWLIISLFRYFSTKSTTVNKYRHLESTLFRGFLSLNFFNHLLLYFYFGVKIFFILYLFCDYELLFYKIRKKVYNYLFSYIELNHLFVQIIMNIVSTRSEYYIVSE